MNVIICWARCDACAYGAGECCPGGDHPWAGPDDLEHAARTGQPPPTGICACPCTQQPPVEPEPTEGVSLDGGPCHLCGEPGACAYDSDGRPLIHASWDEDEYEDLR